MSLSFLWIFTGITSAFFAPDVGYEILAKAGVTGSLASLCLYSGSALDVMIGVWILVGRGMKACYLLQMLLIVVYTILLSFIAPSFWLHPFGPVTKNLPLLVLIYILYSREVQESSDRV